MKDQWGNCFQWLKLRPCYTCGTPPLWNTPTVSGTCLKGMNRQKTYWSHAYAGNGLAPGKAGAVRRAPLRGDPPPRHLRPTASARQGPAAPRSSGAAATRPKPPAVSRAAQAQCRPGVVGGAGPTLPTVGPGSVRSRGPGRDATPPPAAAGGGLWQAAPPGYCVWRLGARRAPERPAREEPTDGAAAGKRLLRLGRAGSGVLRGHSRAARTPRRSLPGRLALRAGARALALSPTSAVQR